MITQFPCFKVAGLTRLDANHIEVSGMRVFVDRNANGVADVPVYVEPNFVIFDATGLNSVAKIGAQIRIRFDAIVAALMTAPPAPEPILVAQIGEAFAEIGGALTQVNDPDTTPGAVGS